MKILTFIILFLLISSCANRNKTFWCGDHPCINIKERKAYFKENLIIEVRELNKKNKEEMSKIEKIIKQTRISEKKRTREEKKISKQIKAEERRKLEEEKELAKKMKLDEKKKLNEVKKNEKKKKTVKKKEKLVVKEVEPKALISISESEVLNTEFEKMAEIINKKNKLKPYPNINSLPK